MSGWDGILLLLLVASAPIVTYIALVLGRAAWKRPGISFLTATAIMTAPIAAVVDVSVLAGINNVIGQPVAIDTVRVAYRLILLTLVGAVFRWYVVYRKTGFKDK